MAELPRKVLVANRGEIALRVIRSCRELGVPVVAVYSDVDRNSLHVRAANEAWLLGPAPPRESYLRGDKIIELARQCGADSIHPGYGFLAENAAFARAVLDAGIVWIGPPPEAIAVMGDKVAARAALQEAGVPLVPGLTEEAADLERLRAAAAEVGYPVMIKASGGGGGKGIRIVEEESALADAFERARSEAMTGFGNDAVYLEKYLPEARHVEIQVFADTHGNVVHLGERECSLQRRHQKILEESPSPVVTDEMRARMGEAAVRAAAAVGYVNAGTVEFLVDPDREFYFLEMNTRLQVEHPVTEMVTGIDLVREQLRVAAGAPLSIRQADVQFRGHAIEVRVCSEEPERGFLPATGTVQSLEVPGGPGVRFDSALYPGLTVDVHYDPMLAKLIVRGRDRGAALERLGRALEELKVTGVATNAAFLLRLVRSEATRSGRYHTQWVEQHLDELVGPPPREHLETVALLATVLHGEIQRRRAVEASGRGRRGVLDSPWATDGRQRSIHRWRP